MKMGLEKAGAIPAENEGKISLIMIYGRAGGRPSTSPAVRAIVR